VHTFAIVRYIGDDMVISFIWMKAYDGNGDYVRELDAGCKPSNMLYPGAIGSGTFY